MNEMTSRRRFLTQTTVGATALGVSWQGVSAKAEEASNSPSLAFFVISDTHFLADKASPTKLLGRSEEICGRLVDTLNGLAGTEISSAAGGGRVHEIAGVIHAGDVIDTGDKAGDVQDQMQQTELAKFTEEYGLTGREGRLKYPIYEIAGNHDAPQGTGYFIDAIKKRNPQRSGVTNVSENGVHYSWDWAGVHFINLGLIVGAYSGVERRRRYAALDSLAFLQDDLQKHVGDSKRPVVLTHHVDLARYAVDCDPTAPADSKEWDPCDVHEYYEAIKLANVVGIFYGHTIRAIYSSGMASR